VDESGNDVPEGQVGELLVRTDDPEAMNAGYWNMPEATETAWRGGWFHTGDLLRRDSAGYFYFMGRRKDVIRVRGENVSAHELEQIVNTFEGILESAALGIPADGGEETILLAISTIAECPDNEALLQICRDRLPKYMVPSEIVRMEELPKTPTGKVQKDQLRAALKSLQGSR
jgi:crotonobetaine/carnitine-CoA ligase